MMRKLFVLAMVAGLVGMGGYARDARAGATVDLLWIGKNGAPIAPTTSLSVLPSETLTLAVIMTNDEALTAAVFSINYDLAGESLDVVSAFQWGGLAINAKGSDFFAPVAPLAPSTATFVGSFQGVTTNFSLPRTLPIAGGAFAGGYQMGTITFHASAAGTQNVVSGILNFGVDAFGDGGFNDISTDVAFNSVVATVIPEPGTAALLGLGLVGLVLMGRRNRS